MKYLLDTNICSYIIKHRPVAVFERFKALQIEDCGISVITYAELKYWIAKNQRLHKKSQNQGSSKVNADIINNFVAHLDIVEFNTHAANIYAEIRDAIQSQGIIVANNDLLIAAHAISLNVTLVTNNIKDFQAIPNIQLENWLA